MNLLKRLIVRLAEAGDRRRRAAFRRLDARLLRDIGPTVADWLAPPDGRCDPQYRVEMRRSACKSACKTS